MNTPTPNSEVTRYISIDGERLFQVPDMAALFGSLREDKDSLKMIYKATKYHLDFECALNELVSAGIVEVVGKDMDFPFEGLRLALLDFQMVFTSEEIAALDEELERDLAEHEPNEEPEKE